MPGIIILQLPADTLKVAGDNVPLNAIVPLPIQVEAGQAIAVFVNPGKDIPPDLQSSAKWNLPGAVTLSQVVGEGILVGQGDYPTLTASRKGVVIASESGLKVSGIFEVLGNVDKRSGNIETYTSVIIHGNVGQGATIVSGGDVEIRGLVEEASIRAAGSIVAKGGVTGGGTTKLVAGKDVYCQFVQQANIEAVGNIVVDGSLMNSVVMCGKKLNVRKSGFMVGGKIMARESIEVSRIGSEAAVITEIELGGNPFQTVQIEEAKEKTETMEKGVQQLRAGVRIAANNLSGLLQHRDTDLVTSLFTAAEVAKTEGEKLTDGQKESMDKYGGGIMSLLRKAEEYEIEKNNLAALMESSGFFDRTRLTVSKIAHPGTMIRMGGVTMRLDKEYERCAFYWKQGEIGVAYQ